MRRALVLLSAIAAVGLATLSCAGAREEVDRNAQMQERGRQAVEEYLRERPLPTFPANPANSTDAIPSATASPSVELGVEESQQTTPQARPPEPSTPEPSSPEPSTLEPSTPEPSTPEVQTPTSTRICDYSATADPVIKGNVGFDSGERIYHVPGGEFYEEAVINPSYGERWFCTEADAIAAGWRRSYY